MGSFKERLLNLLPKEVRLAFERAKAEREGESLFSQKDQEVLSKIGRVAVLLQVKKWGKQLGEEFSLPQEIPDKVIELAGKFLEIDKRIKENPEILANLTPEQRGAYGIIRGSYAREMVEFGGAFAKAASQTGFTRYLSLEENLMLGLIKGISQAIEKSARQ